MPRRLRFASGGYVYHALNRSVGRATLFDNSADYAAFEKVLRQAQAQVPMRVLAFCLMPNHWHLVLWPRQDNDLSEYLRWLTVTHTQCWHANHHTSGTGPLYQGRFKSFPIQEDGHLLTVCRYVEGNALRTNQVPQAEQWRWSSLWHRVHGTADLFLSAGPVPLPEDWGGYVNGVETEAELEAVRRSVVRGAPFGAETWQQRTAKRLGLESTSRARGRPHNSASD